MLFKIEQTIKAALAKSPNLIKNIQAYPVFIVARLVLNQAAGLIGAKPSYAFFTGRFMGSLQAAGSVLFSIS